VCDFGGHPGHVPLGKGSAADPWGGWGDRSQTYLQLFFPQFANMLPIRVSVYQQKLLKLKRLPILSTEDDCVCSLCLCME